MQTTRPIFRDDTTRIVCGLTSLGFLVAGVACVWLVSLNATIADRAHRWLHGSFLADVTATCLVLLACVGVVAAVLAALVCLIGFVSFAIEAVDQ